ncbi:MAG TPA: OmpW family outer membrane protein [Steroidobacter sp.]
MGTGVTYTLFFDEKTTDALSGTKLELDPHWGLAAQFSFDVQLTGDWFANLDARWLGIDTDVTLNDTPPTSPSVVTTEPFVAPSCTLRPDLHQGCSESYSRCQRIATRP